jgi:NADPH2:quinone reductase
MKAVRIEEFGGPEVLQTADIPVPVPGEDEVLIELRASGVNRADVLTRGGGYHAAAQPPIVPGFEGSGIVREIGSAVTSVSIGDRVLAFGGRPGFYAEYVAVPQGRVVRAPEDLDWDSAAALPVAPLSAWYCLRRLAQLRSCEKVLIWAAGSGVGDAAVQISKHLGASVIAIAGSNEKVAWALENGADEGINRAREDVLGRTREITGGEGVEVVLDTVGGRVFGESLKLTGHGGRVVALANVALEESTIDTRDFYLKNVTICGFQIINLMQHLGYEPRGDLEELADLVARGKLKVNVDKVFPLEGVGDAHRYLERRQNRGKVMIYPQD